MTTERKGFIAELFARRVPQILGVYIGACWLVVEMGEWAAEQIGFAPTLVAYVFVLMIALLPSVAVLAWNHGAPGRDRSPRFEKFFVPANLVAALVAVVAFFGYAPPGAPGSAIAPVESAVVERTVVDEAGEERTFTVAREGYHRYVLASFWQQADTDAAPDWRQYAVPWLLGVALNRDPLLSIRTAYELSIAGALRDAGFPEAVGEPRALAIRLAERAGIRYLLRGELTVDGEGLVLTARVIDGRSGEVTGEARAEGTDLIDATERLADRLRPLLTPEGAPEDRFTTLPLAEAASSSEAAIEALIEGLNRLQLSRDFEGAVEAAERAREIDPTFALAHVWLNQLYRFVGDLPAASAAAEQALTLEYKLDSEVVFAMKANRFAQSGDYPTAIRVLRMWTEVHPESFQAWITLAQNMITMGDVDEARRALEEAERTDPTATRLQRMFATVESLSGDYEEAARRLRAYIDVEPRDSDARLELGRALIRAGQPDAAMEAYQAAELVADDSRGPRLAQAALHIRQGRFDAADRILDPLLAASGPPDRRTAVLLAHFDRLTAAGQLRALLARVAEEDATLQSGLGPQGYWLKYSEWLSGAHRNLGEIDAALAAVGLAEDALGDPVGRFLALQRIELLIDDGAPIEALEAQVERLAFFESQFSISGAVAMVGWARAKLALARGESGAAVELMREARERFRESGSSLDADSSEAFDLELARLLRADGQAAEASRLLDDLLVQHPALGEARLERAALRAEGGDPDAARDDLERLFEQWAEASDGFQPLLRARRLHDELAGR